MTEAQAVDLAAIRGEQMRAAIKACDAKLSQYRAALDAGADPAVVTAWIADAHAERHRIDSQLRAATAAATLRLTRAENSRLVTALGDIHPVLREADPLDMKICCCLEPSEGDGN